MAGNKIAMEIMKHFDETEYNKYVRHLSSRDAVSITQFLRSKLRQHYWIDIRRCFIVEQLNPNHVLEMFGMFSDLDAPTLRDTALNMMMDEFDYWKHVGTIVTQMNFMMFEEWYNSMKQDNCMCDKLMVYILSRLHYHHTIIYTSNRPWCNLQNSLNMDITELHSKCDLHLVYLGNNMYSQLKRKPMTPAPPTSVPKLPMLDKRKISKKKKAVLHENVPIDLSYKPGKTSDSQLTDKNPDVTSTLPSCGFNQSSNNNAAVSIDEHQPVVSTNRAQDSQTLLLLKQELDV